MKEEREKRNTNEDNLRCQRAVRRIKKSWLWKRPVPKIGAVIGQLSKSRGRTLAIGGADY